MFFTEAPTFNVRMVNEIPMGLRGLRTQMGSSPKRYIHWPSAFNMLVLSEKVFEDNAVVQDASFPAMMHHCPSRLQYG